MVGYRLLYGEDHLHDPANGLFVDEGSCSPSITSAGELKFTLPPDHPMLGKIELLQKEVETVLYDGEDEVFRGRVMKMTRDFDNAEEYVCEGRMAYLNDVQLRPYSTEDAGMPKTPSAYFNWLVASYNERVDARYRVHVGINEADRIQQTIECENSKLVTIRQELNEKMIDSLGGYVRMRFANGMWYIDYLAEAGKESAQRIEFGENMTDYMRKSSAYERYTAVVPVGKNDDDEVWIRDLPDGRVFEGIRKEGDRLVDEAAARKYGIVEYALECDASLPINVQAAGISFLRANSMGDSLEIEAVDRHLIDQGIERVSEGDYVRVVSEPHGIDAYYLCLERTIRFTELGQDRFTLGTEVTALTGAQRARIASLNAGINKSYEAAQGASQAAKDAAKEAEEKARIFTEQPVPPYSVGDLWSQGAGGDILKCEHGRSGGEEFHANDWMLASKYTDDALAELAKEAAEAAKDAADQAFADAKDAADKALEAKNAADEATAKTEVVESQVTEVREAAGAAKDAADAAQATADDAKDKADAAESAAVIAQGAAEAAQGSALDAATSAGEAVSVANEAKKQVGDVAADAVKLREDLEGQISSVSSTMEADYTKKTDLTATESKLITQIEQSAAAIKLEASQTYAKHTDLTEVEADLNAKIEVNASGIEQAVKESTTAKADASDAKAKADAAQTAAGAASSEAAQAAAAASGAQSAADKAKADALAAQQKAEDAKSAADKAQEDYDDLSVRADVTDEQLAAAQEAVDAANKAAGTAQSAADAAKGAANAAQQTADRAKADSATAQAAADAAKAKADEAADAVAGLEGRVTTAETKITQNANAITSVATRTTAVENKFGGYSTTEQMNSAIEQKADSITQSVSKTYATKEELGGIEVGGRNLVLDSASFTHTRTNATNSWMSPRLPIDNSEYGIDLLKGGGEFTLSFDYEASGITTAANLAPYLKYTATSYSSIGKSAPLAVGASSGHYEHTFTPTSAQQQYGTDWLFNGLGAGSNAGAVFVIRNVKFEKGNKATDWTPAPEDAQSAIDAVESRVEKAETAIEQNADAITLRATKTEAQGYASAAKSEAVSAAAGDATTKANNALAGAKTYADAQIKVQADRITSNVAETTALGKRMSTVEQTASGLSVRLDTTDKNVTTAQSTANTAKTNAATAQTTANTAKTNAATAQSTADTAKANAATAQTTANTAKTNAATAQSTANTARTEAANAAKTATNYMEYSSAGLDVGNKSSGKWVGFRTRMASSAFQVLDAAGAVLASYGASLVELGKNSATAVIKFCNGLVQISANSSGIAQFTGSKGINVLSLIQGSTYQAYGSANSLPTFDGTSVTSEISAEVATKDGGNAKYAAVQATANTKGSTVDLIAGTVSANGNPLYGAKVLYDNASGVWGTITLNETAANFKYMEFYYKKPEGDHFWNCSKVHDPNDKRVGFLVAQVASDPSVTQTLMGGVAIVGTSVSIYTMSRYNNGSSWVMDSTTLRIYRIVGYR